MSDFLSKPHRIKLGEAIRARREALGISQASLAETMSCGKKNIYEVEKGLVNVGIDFLTRIAFALNTTVNDLIEF